MLRKIALADKMQRTIGILAERVTEVMRLDESLFRKSGVNNEDAAYLGDVLTDNRGILQRLTVSEVLPKATQQMLFG